MPIPIYADLNMKKNMQLHSNKITMVIWEMFSIALLYLCSHSVIANENGYCNQITLSEYQILSESLRKNAPPENIDVAACILSDEDFVAFQNLLAASNFAGAYELFVLAQANTDLLCEAMNTEIADVLGKHVVKDDIHGTSVRKTMWQWMPYAEAAIVAYERTGERRFIDLTFSGCRQLLRQTDSQLGIVDNDAKVALSAWGMWVSSRSDPQLRKVTITASGVILWPCVKTANALLTENNGHCSTQDT